MPRKFIQEWVSEVFEALEKQGVGVDSQLELTVLMVNRARARALNKKYRNRDYATDILSFEGDGRVALGELILCQDVLVANAKRHNLTYRQELGYMLLHGILHLLGFDHEGSEAEGRKMFFIQDQVFDCLCRKFWN